MSKYVHYIDSIIYNISDTEKAPVGNQLTLDDSVEPMIWIEFFVCDGSSEPHNRNPLYLDSKNETKYSNPYFQNIINDSELKNNENKYSQSYIEEIRAKLNTTILYQVSLKDFISDGDRCVGLSEDKTKKVICPSQPSTDGKGFKTYWDLYQTFNMSSNNNQFYIDMPRGTKYFSAIEAENFGLLYPGNWTYHAYLKNLYRYSPNENGTVGVGVPVDSEIDVSSKTKLNANNSIDNFITSLKTIKNVTYLEKEKKLNVEHVDKKDIYTLTIKYEIDCPYNVNDCPNKTLDNDSTDSTVGVGDEDANIIEG